MRGARQRGFTLIELMVTVAIISVLAAIALPIYNDYIGTSREGVLLSNISTMEVFQEDFRLRNGNYLTVAADAAAIEAGIGWQPGGDAGVAYSIAAGPAGSYEVTAVDDAGISVCLRLPDKVRCD